MKYFTSNDIDCQIFVTSLIEIYFENLHYIQLVKNNALL